MERFRILPGLPATGPRPEQFSPTGHGTHSEGFVVEFVPMTKASWVGNFQGDGGTYSGILPFPDGGPLVVISKGLGYVINLEDRSLIRTFGGSICSVLAVPDSSLLIFGSYTDLQAWDANFMHWQTRRISWDGIRNLRVEAGWVKGRAWTPIGDYEIAFEVNIETGEAFGWSY
jgi:hypothetical protein